MPTFRLKNLNVSLVDPDDLQLQQTPQFCTIGTTTILSPWCCRFWVSPQPPTGCWIQISPITCRFTVTEIDPCGPISPVVVDPRTAVINPAEELAQLELMRGQLEELMVAIDERGVQLQQQARPQTREDVEMLEEQLKGALDEIQAMKEEMD